MRKGLFAKLAMVNIRKNKQVYVPYILTCIFNIAMLYMMLFINGNQGMKKVPRGRDVITITGMGTTIIVIFSVIFLIYSNSFLMKRRRKELGLYNILGMEKKHIRRMMCVETVVSSLVSFVGGICLGILGSKLAILFLLKLIHIPAQFGFNVSWDAIGLCAGFYGILFFVILLINISKVQMTNPMELLRSGRMGEKEPKAKWLIALVGFICLGIGYYIAITTESPLKALTMFFIAVLLVMVGTYLVFTAGSIAVLHVMRWKKSFYYKARNFTSVSGMLYRMKQNAVGLASICILSTGVLLMISTTVCLNLGISDLLDKRYAHEVLINVQGMSLTEGQKLREQILEEMKSQQIPYENEVDILEVTVTCNRDGNHFSLDTSMSPTIVPDQILLVPASEYMRAANTTEAPGSGEMFVYDEGKKEGESIFIQDQEYQVKKWMESRPEAVALADKMEVLAKDITMIVSDEDFEKIYELHNSLIPDASRIELEMDLDVQGNKAASYGDQIREYIYDLSANLSAAQNEQSGSIGVSVDIRDEKEEEYYGLYGGLLFLGLFLGFLFLVGTAVIIYYKQVSEGYEDKERFEIMQKVGMSKKEVKSSIRRQILMVFFLPLLMAALHITMAFPMVRRLMLLFGMDNVGLFVGCTVGTFLAFSLIYGLIYLLTAKVYYGIVERKTI